LARFYQEVFGRIHLPPERDFQCTTLEAGIGIPGAPLRGIHLLMPGCGETEPALKVFSYTPQAACHDTLVNRSGYARIAFKVGDVPEALAAVLAAGGKFVRDVITQTFTTGAKVTWCYLADPQGKFDRSTILGRMSLS
jgi:catechol 2,3-dioxygenase-like lactoylglutathione lyase family enzyme